MRSFPKRLLAIAMVAGLSPAALAAQQPTTVTGRVTTEANVPLEGVAVSIPELRLGGYTDRLGAFTVTAPVSATGRTMLMIARRVGYKPDSVQLALSGGAVTQNFQLAASATTLTGVVVTALGIEREKSTLGTSQQQISSEDLNNTKAMNLVQQVQGKVSGVTITGGGTPGGSTNVIIRGQNTFASNNQPLFIVDGIPVSNSNRGGGLGNGYDFGNAISDINPEDVESFTILKGPNAAAIYGSRAQNGAVVITTKKGAAGRMRTEISTLYTWEQPGRLPDFQNLYGQGAGGQFQYVNGAGGGNCDGCDQSYGPKMDGRLIDQFTGPQQPWVPHPDNVSGFFETGHTFATTLAMSGGTDRASARMSVGVDNVDGYVPNNFFQKTTGLLSGQLAVTPKLTTNAVLSYARNNARNRPGVGYNNSIMEQFFWYGRQVDTRALKNYQQGGAANGGPANREFNWNYNYHNNPYYIQEANPLSDSRDRFMIQGGAQYKFTDWLNASLRSGSDIFRFNIDQRFGAAFLNGAYVNPAYQGGFQFITDYRNENNTELMINANRDISSMLGLNLMLGGNMRREFFDTRSTTTTGLSVAEIYNVANAAITPTLGQRITRRNMNSVYGSAAATINNYWTIEGTARNDVSSTLPKGENSYFYPSINTSLILSEAIPSLQGSLVNFLKVRASWAEVGNDADPYQLSTTYTGNPNKFGGRSQFTLGQDLLEPNLKPEITRAMEGGIEAGFFDGRASVDFTVYDKRTRNQIYLVPVSPTTGYANKLINAGEMQNKGFEALLTVTPVQMNDFTWTSSMNYSRNKNTVLDLAAGVNRILLGNGLFGDMRVLADKGKPYGSIWGFAEVRCDDDHISGGDCTAAQRGLPLIEDGFRIITDTMVYLGTIQPKWTGGWSNQVTWKNISVGALLDIHRGGKIMSYTNYIGDYSGVLESSLKGREVDWNNPGVVAQGIDIATGQPNTVNVTSEEYFQAGFFNVEPYVYENNWVKLREMRVGYDIPAKWASNLRLNALSLALVGRNLAIFTDIPNVDPEFAFSSGPFQGVEYAFPGNAKTIGLNVRLTP